MTPQKRVKCKRCLRYISKKRLEHRAIYCSEKCKKKDRMRRYWSKYGRYTIPLSVWKEMGRLYLGGKCASCENTEGLEIDHKIPRAQGGGGEISNLQLLCKICHRIKSRDEQHLREKGGGRKLNTITTEGSLEGLCV